MREPNPIQPSAPTYLTTTTATTQQPSGNRPTPRLLLPREAAHWGVTEDLAPGMHLLLTDCINLLWADMTDWPSSM